FIVTEILTYVSFFYAQEKRRWFPPTPKFIEPYNFCRKKQAIQSLISCLYCLLLVYPSLRKKYKTQKF
ncbi:hypothetical protein, partial [Holdemania filiformis]|uniref:hypothetical protein n=1 Tax=Holdemania filiformis TaxID=61171 RepID=UPI0024317425